MSTDRKVNCMNHPGIEYVEMLTVDGVGGPDELILLLLLRT